MGMEDVFADMVAFMVHLVFMSLYIGCYLFSTRKGWDAIRKYWPYAVILSGLLISFAIGDRLI